jgi:hypothetical protein
MAQGDGWERHILLDPVGNSRKSIRFGDFDPMVAPEYLFTDPSRFTLSATLRRRPDGSFELLEHGAAPVAGGIG